jgi:hypothetical protein
VPNEQNDMHDGSIRQGDDFLKNNLDAYVQWARSHNSLLIVTFDEDGSTPGNNQRIPTIFVGPMVQSGSTESRNVNHFDVLRTLEDMYGLPATAAAATATPITSIWALASRVNPLPVIEARPNFTVSWTGTPGPSATTIASFDIFFSDNGGPFRSFLRGTTLTSATFHGTPGHRYRFFSVATDDLGNRQPSPTAAQATTLVRQ